jgi:Ca2+-binding RTX toxin-like protein
MNIKGINSIKFAGPGETPGDNTQEINPELEAKAQQLIYDLENAKKNLEDVYDDSEIWPELRSDEQAKILSMKARIEGELALLDAFLETGVWPGVGNMEDGYGFWNELPDLDSGWNGSSNCNYQYVDHGDEIYTDYETSVTEDPTAGNLQEVIEVPKNSPVQGADPLQSLQALGFAIKDSDDVEKVTGKTVGEDIWITVDYENKESETWVLKGLATRPDVQIYISAEGCTESIHMDFSQAIRINVDSDGNATTNTFTSFFLIGGKGDDIIIGSQSIDTIVGWEGADFLSGLGGGDFIYGDGVYKPSPTSPYIMSINDDTGGDDTIDGGDGHDTISAGGGIDTVARDIRQPGGSDSLMEEEYYLDFKDQVNLDDFSLSAHLNLEGWEADTNAETGEIVLTKIHGDPDNEVHIQAPGGYTMAYSEDAGQDIVITFAKMDEDGETTYLRVRIKGALAGDNQTFIEVKANDESTIMDFSRLVAEGNIIKLTGKEGDDTLIAPITNLSSFGIDASELDDPSKVVDLNAIMENTTFVDEETDEFNWGGHTWDDAKVDPSGDHIVLTPVEGEEGIALSFVIPGDFDPDKVYYLDEGYDRWLYIIDKHDDGSFDMIKIKIVGGAVDGVIESVMATGEEGGKATLEPLGHVLLEGADGDDLIVGSRTNVSDWGGNVGNDTVLKGSSETDFDDPNENGVEEFDADNIAYYDGEVVLNQNDNSISMLDEDADGDGVNNKDEIDGGSNPNDPNSIPEDE